MSAIADRLRGALSTAPGLLVLGTLVAAWLDLVYAYVPFLLGGVSMLPCFAAHQRSTHKPLVIAYIIILIPFAFSYPALLAFIFIEWKWSGYTGAMP